MKIKTTRFGTITTQEDKIIHMPFGMLGFPYQKQFVLLQHKENSPFLWYQSVDDPALAFVITNPYAFKADYTVDLDNIIKEMSWDKSKENDELQLYVVVNIPKGSPNKITANLIGPILINKAVSQAVQVIISDSPYSHKFPLMKGN